MTIMLQFVCCCLVTVYTLINIGILWKGQHDSRKPKSIPIVWTEANAESYNIEYNIVNVIVTGANLAFNVSLLDLRRACSPVPFPVRENDGQIAYCTRIYSFILQMTTLPFACSASIQRFQNQARLMLQDEPHDIKSICFTCHLQRCRSFYRLRSYICPSI